MTENKEQLIDNIGAMHGLWELALKLALVLTPVMSTAVIAHMTWSTSLLLKLDHQSSNLVTHKELTEAIKVIDQRIDTLPPEDWQFRITKMEDLIHNVLINQAAIQQDISSIKNTLDKKGMN